MSDPITEELFRNAISAIGDEMVLTIYRTAYSGVLKNIMDYSVAICDAQGRLVAQGLSLPGHLCSIPVALRAVLAHFGEGAKRVVAALARRGILVRDRSSDLGGAGYVRVTLGTMAQTRRLLRELMAIL